LEERVIRLPIVNERLVSTCRGTECNWTGDANPYMGEEHGDRNEYDCFTLPHGVFSFRGTSFQAVWFLKQSIDQLLCG
jgi:hypothetical protein